MRPWWTSLLTSGRRRGRRAAALSTVPLRRLVAAELAWGLRQVLHPVKLGVALVVTVVLVAALGPLTPGLVLSQGWRLTVAVVLGLTSAALAHALFGRGRVGASDDRRVAVRRLLGAVALLLAGTVVLAFVLASVTGSTDPEAGAALDAGLAVDRPLLVGAALLTAGVLAAAIGARLQVPGALLFLGLGMLIGEDGLGWATVSQPFMVQSLGVLALVIILFEGGLTTDTRQLHRGAAPGLALATVGVALTAGVTALGAVWLLGLPSRVAWLVGAIVASTDAAAVFELLRRAPLPERLSSLLKVESGANDPVAVLLTVGLLSAWGPPATTTAWLAFGALQLVGGAALGGAGGWLAAVVLRRVELGTAGLYPVLALAAAGVTYGLAVAVGASGFLAVYVAGIVLAAEVPRRRVALRTFHTALANGAEVSLFLLLGLLVLPSQLPSVALTALGVAALLILVGRPLACAVALAPMGFPAKEIAVVSWLGMRGAVPIVLATFAASAGIAEAARIFDVVFFVVLTSALVQGLSAVPVIRALGLAADRSTADVVTDALPLEGTGLDVVEVVVPDDSPLSGQLLRDVQAPGGALIAVIVRGTQTVVPRGDTRIHPDDLLVVTTVDQDEGISRIERWARTRDDPTPEGDAAPSRAG